MLQLEVHFLHIEQCFLNYYTRKYKITDEETFLYFINDDTLAFNSLVIRNKSYYDQQ